MSERALLARNPKGLAFRSLLSRWTDLETPPVPISAAWALGTVLGAHKGRTEKSKGRDHGPVRCESLGAPAADAERDPGRARLVDEAEAALRALDVNSPAAADPATLCLAAERRALVFDAVRHLSPARRELICRVYGINRRAEVVREVSGSWGAAKSRVDRMLVKALADLRELLAERGT
jgi:RNA polymerase sigma factor for flagellar operon FliA